MTNGLDPANLAGGDKLSENCTECHRGNNVFIMHPGTALQRGKSNPCESDDDFPDDRPTAANKRYQPIGSPKFKNPPPDPVLTKKLGVCVQCHEIPALTRAYCGTVLGLPPNPADPNGVIGKKTMPPPDGATQSDADVKKDIATLTAACNALP